MTKSKWGWRQVALLALLLVQWTSAESPASTNFEDYGTCSLDEAGSVGCKSSVSLDVQVGVGCKPKKLNFVAGAESSDAAKNCGEDAYYVVQDSRYVSFGVADGVGGWQESGVDPSAFSLALVEGAKIDFERADESPRPQNLLESAFAHVKAGGDKNPGGSTAVFLVLDRSTGVLETANLGDSGYLVIRQNQKLFRSVEQTWAFNAPFQLSLYPSSMGESVDHYLPNDAFVTTHSLQHGDIVIVGSDGLFDNVFDEEILAEAEKYLNDVFEAHQEYKAQLEQGDITKPLPKDVQASVKKAMEDLSFALTDMANEFAHDSTLESPFSKLAREGYGYEFSGGKVDDTTVVAVYIHPQDTSPAL